MRGAGTRPGGLILCLFLFLWPTAGPAGEFYTLEGHGGPIKGIAVSPDGASVLTASFDYALGLWRGREPRWLEEHRAAANAVRFVDDARAVSAGDDFTVLLWDLAAGRAAPLGRHDGKVIALAVSPDATQVASASWDGTVGLWPTDGGSAPQRLAAHRAGVNDVAFSADGRLLYSASADGTLRVWPVDRPSESRVVVNNGFGINTLAVNDRAGWIAFGAVDGVTHVIEDATGAVIADFTLGRRPILAMAADRAGRMLAIGDGKGYLTIVDTTDWSILADFRASATGPIWALAFSADGENILAGGLDDTVYAFPLDGLREAPKMAGDGRAAVQVDETASNGERQFRRRCAICHTLDPDGRRRAGPSLSGLFGRRAGIVPGYVYSKALSNADITWDEHTIDALFDLGPDVYIAGTKMPVQRIAGAKDRADLIAFLRQNTDNGEPDHR